MQRNVTRLVLTAMISLIVGLIGIRANIVIQPINPPQVADPGGGSGTGGLGRTGIVS